MVNLASLAVPVVLLAGAAVLSSMDPPEPELAPMRTPHLLVLSLQPDRAVIAGRALSCSSSCFEQGYDLAALDASLAELKELQPDKQQILIVPDGGVPYARLLEVMDTVRPHFPLQTVQPAP